MNTTKRTRAAAAGFFTAVLLAGSAACSGASGGDGGSADNGNKNTQQTQNSQDPDPEGTHVANKQLCAAGKKFGDALVLAAYPDGFNEKGANNPQDAVNSKNTVEVLKPAYEAFVTQSDAWSANWRDASGESSTGSSVLSDPSSEVLNDGADLFTTNDLEDVVDEPGKAIVEQDNFVLKSIDHFADTCRGAGYDMGDIPDLSGDGDGSATGGK